VLCAAYLYWKGFVSSARRCASSQMKEYCFDFLLLTSFVVFVIVSFSATFFFCCCLLLTTSFAVGRTLGDHCSHGISMHQHDNPLPSSFTQNHNQSQSFIPILHLSCFVYLFACLWIDPPPRRNTKKISRNVRFRRLKLSLMCDPAVRVPE